MLLELYIRNLALIEEARIPFGPGLTILTGETGSGKSIVLDALSLLLGGRASTDFIRQGADRTTLEAVFTVAGSAADDAPLKRLFEEAGIEWASDDTIVISRDLLANGKTVSRLNGRIVTVNFLKQAGTFLVDMAGQHENQSLLRPDEHLKIIDTYGGMPVAELLGVVGSCYAEYQEAKKRLKDAQLGEQERALRLDMLRYQIQEIESVQLKPSEEDSLEQERRRLTHAEKLFGVTQTLYAGLYEGEGRSSSVIDRLAAFQSELESALRIDPALQSTFELLQSAQVQLEEAAFELREYRDDIEFNPDRLAQIHDRLTAIAKLKRKYGDSAADILAYLEKIRLEVTELENHDQTLEILQRQLKESGKRLTQVCGQLSGERRRVAEEVSGKIMAELSRLLMPKTQIAASFHFQADGKGLQIDSQTVQVTERGIDQVEFLFSPNSGEPLRPLSKIASGGELSRIMLAWKTILAGTSGVETLVFDEIDTGISGRAAQAVAEQMGLLSKRAQVLVVTHLPQVACMADTHLQIYKEQVDGRVYTRVEPLAETQRVEELARMLSGAELTDTSRLAAEEMLRLARLVKAS